MNAIIVNDYAYVNGGTGNVAFYTAKLLAGSGVNTILGHVKSFT